MTTGDTQRWIEAYLSAWRSNDPDEIRALFAEEARYYTAPYRPPWVGHQAILDGWVERKDPPDSWSFEYRVVAEEDGTGVVEGITRYLPDGDVYSNLWLVDLDVDGRCPRFVEYFMLVPKESAPTAGMPQ